MSSEPDTSLSRKLNSTAWAWPPSSGSSPTKAKPARAGAERSRGWRLGMYIGNSLHVVMRWAPPLRAVRRSAVSLRPCYGWSRRHRPRIDEREPRDEAVQPGCQFNGILQAIQWIAKKQDFLRDDCSFTDQKTGSVRQNAPGEFRRWREKSLRRACAGRFCETRLSGLHQWKTVKRFPEVTKGVTSQWPVTPSSGRSWRIRPGSCSPLRRRRWTIRRRPGCVPARRASAPAAPRRTCASGSAAPAGARRSAG